MVRRVQTKASSARESAGFTHHVTGSQAFTENMKKLVGTRAGQQFHYSHQYMQAKKNEIDVLIMDEAHRLRPVSSNRFTPREHRTDKPQVEELIEAAKVCVFFIDDLQLVRPNEIGSSQLIRDSANDQKAKVIEFELETQFRCSGSDSYVNWIDNTMELRRTANILWDAKEEYLFEVVDSIQELEQKIRELNGQEVEGKTQTARLTAGFCWPWSKKPNADGTLIHDVRVDDVDGETWSMPWNAPPEATRLATGIPKSMYWASAPGGIDQVGCIYTAQGFEFDYSGVVFGRDLRYDPAESQWIADKSESCDTGIKRASDEQFLELVKSVYRVLLTRGMKGTFVYFQDEATRNFFKSRMEGRSKNTSKV